MYRVQVQGLGEARDTVARLAALMADPADEHVLGAVAREAAQRAPRRRGRLAASLSATATGISSPLIYAGPIHGGWREHGIEPHPFITQAWEAVAERHLDQAAQRIANE